jgi:peptidoglycan/xylan/chitin deacetylase (PgdA/CDA1 family)
MKALAIMYHDVVERGADDASGFPGAWPARYKLERGEFEKHLNAIRAAIGAKGVSLADGPVDKDCPLFLTFDDGGVSAYDPIAPMLERHGWRGHFFITTDRIGQAGFVTREQIRELRLRGHVIGSHSCSHPTRMSALPREELMREWSASVALLSDILGEAATVGSVPGGYYSRAVAKTAAACGIRKLFNSEPTMHSISLDGCLVLGRYFVQRGMGPEISAGFAAGRFGPRAKQSALWAVKKAAKAVGGEAYLRVMRRVLGRASATDTYPE